MDRPELVDVRQHRPDAGGPRLEGAEAQQRVQPDEPPAGAVQAVRLEGEVVADLALEPVGEEQHDRAPARARGATSAG